MAPRLLGFIQGVTAGITIGHRLVVDFPADCDRKRVKV
jgi:hypothetical protein